jgi:hypothetical protein
MVYIRKKKVKGIDYACMLIWFEVFGTKTLLLLDRRQ